MKLLCKAKRLQKKIVKRIPYLVGFSVFFSMYQIIDKLTKHSDYLVWRLVFKLKLDAIDTALKRLKTSHYI